VETLSVRRLGFALGGGFAALYLSCAFVMLTASHEAAIRFFNSILHGVDVAPIMRWNMPWGEMAVGVLEVFILGWLFGAAIASLYNLGAEQRRQ
jgi:2TM family of unknown function (DUF5676)